MTNNKILPHHIEIECKIIHLMLQNVNVVDEMIEGGFSLEFFDIVHQEIIENIYDEYNSSGNKRLLTRDTYRQKLLDKGLGGNAIISLQTYDKCLFGSYADINDLGTLKEQLKESFVARKVHNCIQEFTDNCKHSGFLPATEVLSEKLVDVLTISETRRSTYVSGAELKDKYIEYLENARANPESIIRCGIKEIDDVVAAGFRPMHFTLFVADIGGMKTSMMINIGLNIAEGNEKNPGRKVLFIPLEMPEFDLMNRIVSNRTGIDSAVLLKPQNLTVEDMNKIRNHDMWIKSQTKFHMLVEDNRTSVSSLINAIKSKTKDLRPEVVIIDYIDNVQADITYGTQRHLAIGEILKSLRFLGKKYKFHIISAAQMNRAAIKALKEGNEDAVDSTSIYGSHQYSADCDTIFALMYVKNEPDKLKIHTIKSRHGPSKQTKDLIIHPNLCQIMSSENDGKMLNDTDINFEHTLQNDKDETVENESVEFSGAVGGTEDDSTNQHELDDLMNMG